MHIGDLHFKDEIVPLFDTVQNERSRDVLFSLLEEFPASLDEIRERQQILSGLMRHPNLLSSRPYHKSEFNEVYKWISDIQSRDSGGDVISPVLQWVFSPTAGKREKARFTQVFLFFQNIFQSWFSPLPVDSFPPGFMRLLNNCRQFLLEMGVANPPSSAGGRGLSLRKTKKLRQFFEGKTRQGELIVFWDDLFLFEAWLSVSRGILRQGFVFPRFVNGRIALTGFYHPLLKNPVKNDLAVSTAVNLLTGPNMSGKSTLLKAVGICVILAHLGLGVPATACEIPFFEYISLSIDLSDDLKNGYSHFMSEVKVLKKTVEAAASGKTCFAVFDELFRGTNAEDALAISATTIKGLTKFKDSFFFISTHLYQLMEVLYPCKYINVHYLECALDGQRPIFTYSLKPGWSELRIGRLLFDQEGLNDLLGADQDC